MTGPAAALPGMPVDADGPVFAEPWQAQAFAMTLALHQNGLFTWVEWRRRCLRALPRRRPPATPTWATPTIAIGWLRWNLWWHRRAPARKPN